MYIYKIPRFFNRFFYNRSHFILVNSFPKSGTHLLYQLFSNQNFLKDYHTFIASMPSINKASLDENIIINKLNNSIENEIIRSHIYYSDNVEYFFKKNNCINFFIYRDPRDVVISEANYLYDMNKWHRLHKYYRNLSNLNDRILFSILGNDYINTDIEYPNINERYNKYIGWINSNECFSIKYEDLITNQKDTIEQIANHFEKKCIHDIDLNEFIKNAISNINPQKSHTFREGGTSKWKKYFTEYHKTLFKEKTGDLLVKLGYEKNNEW